MASTRKTRNVNKRFARVNEDFPDKDGTSANKNKNRKRKLTDMLGSQWSKEELERFYDSYRKYGKDWRKVAGAIRNRTSDMVESLYNMNRAYLSLPEGAATAAGLIAMMTDHYSNLEGSNSENESNNDSPKGATRKAQKKAKGKSKAVSKASSSSRFPDLLQYEPASSSFGILSSLRKKRSGGTRPRAVGKRTPRVPVSSMYNRDINNKLSSPRQQAKQEDDDGAHVAALALAGGLRRGSSSSQVSPSPGKRAIRKSIESDKADGEGSLGSREAENDDSPKRPSYLRQKEGAGPDKIKGKSKKSQRKKQKGKMRADDRSDDDGEACSGTEEGRNSKKARDEDDFDIKDSWGSKGSKKRSRQLIFGDDESAALDALHALADLSVNILLPAAAAESESSAQVKEEKKETQIAKDNSKAPAKKDKRKADSTGPDTGTRKKAKTAKVRTGTSEINKTEKSKRKSLSTKSLKDEAKNDLPKGEAEKTEISVEESKAQSSKAKRASQASPGSKSVKLVKPMESSPSSANPARKVTDVTETTAAGAIVADQAKSQPKSKNRRKSTVVKSLSQRESTGDNRPDKFPHAPNNIADLKEKMSHCLSAHLFRRWCMFEWFYSAIDYPWFAKSEFVEYLNHVKLGHIPRLTRVEWGVIRSSLGKPRRLSKQFLREEREKLAQYRESVRQHYLELRAGVREGLPTDLARPLTVGQRLIACHPKTRELHDGSVLTVDHDRCRVQFDRPELGVEFVMDIDCMPLNPLENMPESLRRSTVTMNKFNTKFADPSNEWRAAGAPLKMSPNENLERVADGPSYIPNSNHMNALAKQAKGDSIDSIVQAKATVSEATAAAHQAMYSHPCTLSQIQEREADIRALADLSRALDKKEALLTELRNMNEEVSGKQKEGESIPDLEHFRKQYAMVLVQLRDANDQVASALLSLRQRNTYSATVTNQWARPVESPGAVPEFYNPSGFISQDSGSQVIEIVETSRRRAKTMVDAAVQAMCALNEGEDALTKITEALEYLSNTSNNNNTNNNNNRNSGSGSSILGIRRIPPDSGHANSNYQDAVISCTFDPSGAHALSPKMRIGFDSEVRLPSELISSCVATLLMIQSCTERQHPPAEVAHILDSALSSLQPLCPQNVPIFKEIETCMGIIKNQMLALIPTPCNAPPAVAEILTL